MYFLKTKRKLYCQLLDFTSICKMTTIETTPISFLNSIRNHENDELELSCSCEIDHEIPYHAREYARPFTYGKLPKGFKQSDLKHVLPEDFPDTTYEGRRQPSNLTFRYINDLPEFDLNAKPSSPSNSSNNLMHSFQNDSKMNVSRKDIPGLKKSVENKNRLCSLDNVKSVTKSTIVLPPSPSMQRKNNRPSVSPSKPVLRKTPTRQEFEEMLRARQEQSLKEQNIVLKESQHASIQKDLDELQEKLNKKVLKYDDSSIKNYLNENPCREVVKLVETIDLPDERVDESKGCHLNAVVEVPRKYEPTLIIADVTRAETPAFPIGSNNLDDRCISPYPMISNNSPVLRREFSPGKLRNDNKKSCLNLSELQYIGQLKTKPENALETSEDVATDFVKFARDSSQYWYKPYITREVAVALLRNSAPGTFLIRNSTTYKEAFGLVLRVVTPPEGYALPEHSFNKNVLVRHFLLEPTSMGVRLKGCSAEPTFTSLSAFVYQHSINPLALPCKLFIPTCDLQLYPENAKFSQSQKELLDKGAACSVLYLFSMDMESLTGDEAIRKTVHEMYSQTKFRGPIEVHFKVSQNGITLTDNKRRLFFRRHYAPYSISHIGVDPDKRFFSVMVIEGGFQHVANKTIFAFVAKSTTGDRDNQCHVFCDLAVEQPASAIISFTCKMLHINTNAKLV